MGMFWITLREIWDTFYSNIWSHEAKLQWLESVNIRPTKY